MAWEIWHETAKEKPKNGQEVLVSDGYSMYIKKYYEKDGGYFTTDGLGGIMNPKYWMEKPLTPMQLKKTN